MVLVKNSKFFHVSISSKIVVQNVSCDILERKKNHFLNYKNNKLKKVRRTDFFFKRIVHGFVQKCEFFCVYLRQNRPGKCVLLYSRNEKHLSRL